jgi:hypothetical protein
MSFGSGSGLSTVSGMSGVRGGNSGQQATLGFALLVVAAVALVGFFFKKPPSPPSPAPDPVAIRRHVIQSEATAVKPIALEMTPQVTRDWINLDGVQDKQGIDNLVVGIVKTAYRKHLGDTAYVRCFGAAGSKWTYASLTDAVGNDLMNAVRTEVVQLNEQFRRDLRRQEASRG